MIRSITKPIFTVLLCLVSTFSIALGQQTANTLKSTEPMMKGHLFALYMDHLFDCYSQKAEFSAPIMVRFNETEALFELKILGRHSNIDRAKRSTDLFRQDLLHVTLNDLNANFGLNLSENDVTISYVNYKTLKTLLIFSRGNYTIQ